jgi:RIO-like serine/threonine protein kinase
MVPNILKRDALGTIRLLPAEDGAFVERDTRTARFVVRWLARRLAAREAAVLTALAAVPCVPRLLEFDGAVVRRTFVAGVALHLAPPPSRAYFVDALRILRVMHRAGVTHNDLAKEANWLVLPDGGAGIVDFQLARHKRQRDRAFRRSAYSDLRHLLKHKRTYQRQWLTARQRRVLATPTLGTRIWRILVKPVYRFVTRALLRWPERTGPEERVSMNAHRRASGKMRPD